VPDRALLEAAPAETRTLLLCAVTTGMRRVELVGLKWGDVDWTANRVWVRRSVGKDGAFVQPNSRRSVRAIAMTSTLASALKLHRMGSKFKDADDVIFASDLAAARVLLGLLYDVRELKSERIAEPYRSTRSFASWSLRQGRRDRLRRLREPGRRESDRSALPYLVVARPDLRQGSASRADPWDMSESSNRDGRLEDLSHAGWKSERRFACRTGSRTRSSPAARSLRPSQ
jgi:hypothetical protein